MKHSNEDKVEYKMEKEFQELKNKVDDIHRLLLGTDHEQEIGILSRLRKNETDIRDIQSWRSKITYFAMGMIIPATYGIVDFIKVLTTTLIK